MLVYLVSQFSCQNSSPVVIYQSNDLEQLSATAFKFSSGRVNVAKSYSVVLYTVNARTF